PWLTRAVFSAAAFIREDGLFVVLGLAILGGVLWLNMRTAVSRRQWHGFILRLPLAGRLLRMMEFERIFRSLAALIGNGVGLPSALELAAAVARNKVIATVVNEANANVREGTRLADALGRHGVVPSLAVQLIRVGEESGELDAMLVKLADIYAAEVETALKRLVAVIEPALIVLIGLFVAIIVISLLSAIVGVNAIAF
ncbi:MAG: type II secretion system F family protein, partial [Rhodospirillales bacterium]